MHAKRMNIEEIMHLSVCICAFKKIHKYFDEISSEH
jgi:hypothetical protein